MRAIIIQDHDARALLDRLELKATQLEERFAQQDSTQRYVADECWRGLRFELVQWLQEQGATVTR